LDEAVRTGRISVEDMFDSDYRIIPDTNPHQYLTNFTSLTDKLLPAIQEPPVNRDSRIRLLCATDRNGYIATHNKQYSEPQRADDPVWNAAHSRNRRIFDDRAGLAAATNQQPVLIQTYVRDMGNQRVLLKEVDCPIKIADRHWGNMRLAFA
ncbi:MAG: chemotaxis protein, partial [Rhodospirillaceae bacterium]